MNVTRLAAAAALALSLAACAGHGVAVAPTAGTPSYQAHFLKPQDSVGGIGTRTVNVNLMDAAPVLSIGNVQHVNLAVTRIDVLQGGNYVTITSYSTPHIIDVLAHQYDNGASAGAGLVNPVTYDGVRLAVDTTQSNVQTATSTYPMSFVNASTQASSGLGSNTTTSFESTNIVDMTVNRSIAISSDSTDGVELDFNAYESLADGNSNSVIARPTLFSSSQEQAGRIQGTVLNSSGNPVVGATVVAVDSQGYGNSCSTDANGQYLLHTLRPSTYQLYVYNGYRTASGEVHYASQYTAPWAGGKPVNGGTYQLSGGQVITASNIND
ncbi:MAG: carboxypeptidase regulatory-like domain-containing protein [Candidatus Eremiobacteraeota bacterium]|nr:carboxypeptidase regulatory-like domain-containing protein [Candidatus Eremiobacteraeota bacterium]